LFCLKTEWNFSTSISQAIRNRLVVEEEAVRFLDIYCVNFFVVSPCILLREDLIGIQLKVMLERVLTAKV